MSKKRLLALLVILFVLGILWTVLINTGQKASEQAYGGLGESYRRDPDADGNIILGWIVIIVLMFASVIYQRKSSKNEDDKPTETQIPQSESKQKIKWVESLWKEGKKQEAFTLLQTLPDSPAKQRLMDGMRKRMEQ